MSDTSRYIPSNDGEFHDFQKEVNSQVSANAANWGISPAKADELNTWSTGYEPYYLAIKYKKKRTPEQIDAHKVYRRQYEPFLREFCQSFLTNNMLIPVSERRAMGLNPRGYKKRSERPQITSAPITELKALGGGLMRFRFRVSDSKRVGRHRYSDGVEIYFKIQEIGGGRIIDPPAPIEPTAINTAGADSGSSKTVLGLPTKDGFDTDFSTKASFKRQLPMADIGKMLYVYARWINTSDPQKSGSFSMVATVIIA